MPLFSSDEKYLLFVFSTRSLTLDLSWLLRLLATISLVSQFGCQLMSWVDTHSSRYNYTSCSFDLAKHNINMIHGLQMFNHAVSSF
jgi:hypothetical protein